MRAHRSLLIGSTLLGSWLGMQALHELGHVCGAWLTGGAVTRVVLHPLTISRTDLTVNPQPLMVAWAGHVLGVTAPLLMWAAASAVGWRGRFLLRFFAGFCLVANGLYISLGSFNEIGDCRVLLANGAARWQLWLFGVITVPLGFVLWHGQGAHFGLAEGRGQVDRLASYTAFAACVLLLLVGILIGGD